MVGTASMGRGRGRGLVVVVVSRRLEGVCGSSGMLSLGRVVGERADVGGVVSWVYD